MIKNLRITVEGKSYDVQVEVLDTASGAVPPAPPTASVVASAAVAAPIAPVAAPTVARPSSMSGDVPSPLSGKVVSIDCVVGQTIKEGEKVLTLEAMKMNTIVSAPAAGKVTAILVKQGDAVEEGQPLITLG